MDKKSAIGQVTNELDHAQATIDSFNSCHEGYAVILEELEELWELVKKAKYCNKNSKENFSRISMEENKYLMGQEAKQIAAMAIRFMVELT